MNRLCTQIADRYGWRFANINLRAYYAEGAKTMGFEIAEQLGWRFPDHVVSPVAGGTLLPRIFKGFRELREIGLVEGDLPRIHAAQPAGSAPVQVMRGTTPTLVTPYATDDDGGFFRWRAWAYYQSGPMPLSITTLPGPTNLRIAP